MSDTVLPPPDEGDYARFASGYVEAEALERRTRLAQAQRAG